MGVCAHLRADDAVFSTHRGHATPMAKGVPPEQLIAELYGRATGCSRGRGGSMHLFAPETGLMGTSGIVGPCILLQPRVPDTASNRGRPKAWAWRSSVTEP